MAVQPIHAIWNLVLWQVAYIPAYVEVVNVDHAEFWLKAHGFGE